jgi:proline racemase
MTRREKLLAKHQELRNAVLDAPRGQKLRRQQELRAWVRSQLERETGRGMTGQLEMWAVA